MKLDLKDLIAKMIGQTEFKTLLWTNPNPDSMFLQLLKALKPLTLGRGWAA